MAGTSGKLPRQFADDALGVSEQHPGLVGEIQRVVDAGKAGVLGPLDGEDGPGLVRVDDGHPVDGAPLVIASRRVYDIVGADN